MANSHLGVCLRSDCGIRVDIRQDNGIRREVITRAKNRMQMRRDYRMVFVPNVFRIIEVERRIFFVVFVPFQADYIQRQRRPRQAIR